MQEGDGALQPTEEVEVVKNLAGKNITVAQLLFLYRKHLEQGTIDSETTVEGLVSKIVRPDTEADKCCYMDYMLGKPRESQVIVYCWWGISFRELVLCIFQHAIGCLQSFEETASQAFASGGLPPLLVEKTYWVDAFALNHHQKFPPGDPHCQEDKIPLVMQEKSELLVAIDSGLQTVQQEQCHLMLESALRRGKKVSFRGDVQTRFGLDADTLVLNQVSEGAATTIKAGIKQLALHRALLAQDLEHIEQLLRCGADANVPVNAEGGSAVMWALEYGRPELFRLLLVQGADPNVASLGGSTPLSSAVQLGLEDLVSDILAARADLNLRSSRDERTALHDAAARGNLELVRKLLEAEADPNLADREGKAPLLEAAQARQTDLVEVLLAGGADPRHKDHKGRSSLLYMNLLRGSSEERCSLGGISVSESSIGSVKHRRDRGGADA